MMSVVEHLIRQLKAKTNEANRLRAEVDRFVVVLDELEACVDDEHADRQAVIESILDREGR